MGSYQKIFQNPNLIKPLDNLPFPLKKEILINNWGIHKIINAIEYSIVPDTWIFMKPNGFSHKRVSCGCQGIQYNSHPL